MIEIEWGPDCGCVVFVDRYEGFVRVLNIFNTCDVRFVTRFLTVAPSTGADEQLVLDIVKFLAVVVTRCEAGTMSNETFSWIGEMLLCNSGALYHLLNKTDQSCDSIDGRSSSQLGSRSVCLSSSKRCLYCDVI